MDTFTPESVRIMSDDVNRRCAGGNGEFFNPDDSCVYHVTEDFVWDDDEAEMDTTAELDETQTFSIRDLVNSQM